MSAIAGERDDTLAALPVMEGDYSVVKLDSTGALWTRDVNSTEDSASLNAIQTELESLSHAEDTAHVSGHAGVMPLAVRQSTEPAAYAGTQGDYAPLEVDENGRLWVTPSDPGVPGVPTIGTSGTFQGFHTPAANTIATVTIASPGAGKRLVLTHATFTLSTNNALSGAANVIAQIVSGGVTLWQGRLAVPGGNGNSRDLILPGLTLVGGVSLSIVASFTAAPGANNFETVAISGYVVNV